MIRVIGDSHVSVFSGTDYMQPTWPNNVDSGANPNNIRANKINGIMQYRLGPHTAYNLHTKIDQINSVLNACDIESDVIFFSAGEIDCRDHISKYIKNNPNAVNEVVDRYISFIKSIVARGFSVGCVLPHIAYWSRNDEYVVKSTIQFNKQMNELCNENGFYSIGVFYENKVPKEDEYIDGLHLSPKSLPILLEQLSEYGIWN